MLVSPVGPLQRRSAGRTGGAPRRRSSAGSRRPRAGRASALSQRLAGLAHHDAPSAAPGRARRGRRLVEDLRRGLAAEPVPGMRRRPRRWRARARRARHRRRAPCRSRSRRSCGQSASSAHRAAGAARRRRSDAASNEPCSAPAISLTSARAHASARSARCRGCSRARAQKMSRGRGSSAAARRAALALHHLDGIARRSRAIGASSSARRLTNEVLAPFSSRRRTRYGEQVLVSADRRVDAAGRVELAVADDLVVQRLAHAVQALELERGGRRRRRRRGDRVGVVGGELRDRTLSGRHSSSRMQAR